MALREFDPSTVATPSFRTKGQGRFVPIIPFSAPELPKRIRIPQQQLPIAKRFVTHIFGD